MGRLIADLLALAREGQSIEEPEMTALTALVHRCWRGVETADADVVVEAGMTVLADPDRLEQLLENLIRNAIEHGGSDVTVTVGRLADGFFVEDDGPGIGEETRDEIFEFGYTTNDEGTGFGLAIVGEIVEGHGWEIEVTAGRDGGARFEITTRGTDG